MRFLRSLMTVTLAVAVTGWPQATSAQSGPSAPAATTDTAAMTDKARDLFREGTRLFREQKWAQAEAAFEAAWALTDKTSRSLVDNLGQTEMRLGKYREAAEHLSVARRLTPPGDKQLADVERDLAEAKKKIGTLAVTCSVDGARIVVGDGVIGKAPLADPVFVDPGSVTVSALLEGYDSAKIQVNIKAGEERPVQLTLARTAPAATATVSAVPTVTSHSPATGPKREIVIAGAVVAGVSLVVGGVLLGAGEAMHGDLRGAAVKNPDGTLVCAKATAPGTADAECDPLRARGGTATMLGQTGIGLLVAGGVVALGTAGYLVFARRPDPTAGVRVTPVIGPSVAGLQIVGGF